MPEIHSVAEFLELVKAFNVGGRRAWFRGQADANWVLQPSILRKQGWIDNELAMLVRFRQIAVSRVVRPPDDDWGWVCLAQHYRLPTRLLDWSENPLVALFFAVERDEDQPGAVFAFDPIAWNSQSYGSPIDLPLLGRDSKLDAFSPFETPAQRADPLAVVAPQSFDRAVAQSGTFTVVHPAWGKDLQTEAGALIEKWEVPLTSKEDLRGELVKIGVSAASVYPDLDRISESIKHEYA